MSSETHLQMKSSNVDCEFSKFPICIYMFLITSIHHITLAGTNIMILPDTGLFRKYRLLVNLETTVTYTRKENNLN